MSNSNDSFLLQLLQKQSLDPQIIQKLIDNGPNVSKEKLEKELKKYKKERLKRKKKKEKELKKERKKEKERKREKKHQKKMSRFKHDQSKGNSSPESSIANEANNHMKEYTDNNLSGSREYFSKEENNEISSSLKENKEEDSELLEKERFCQESFLIQRKEITQPCRDEFSKTKISSNHPAIKENNTQTARESQSIHENRYPDATTSMISPATSLNELDSHVKEVELRRLALISLKKHLLEKRNSDSS